MAGLFIALTLYYRRGRYGYRFRRIPLTQGKYAIVDPEDFERLNKHKWYVSKSPNTFYAVRNIRIGPRKRNIRIRMHREVIHPPDHLVVDHINHDGLDNRKANLRSATRAQNNFNRSIIIRKDSSSKYKGVCWHKSEKRWRAQINVNGERKILGRFKDEIHAAKAYDEAAKKYHGEFASLNFPD
ncbi:AP2 domain-containing protein [Planctomycetota bacterium]